MPADICAELQASFRNFHRLSFFSEIGTEPRNARKAAHQFIKAGAYRGVGTDSASPLNFHTEAMGYEMSALVRPDGSDRARGKGSRARLLSFDRQPCDAPSRCPATRPAR